MKKHNQYYYYHQQGLKLINRCLPGSLTNVIQPGSNKIFSIQFTIQQGFQNLLDTVTNNGEAHVQYQILIQEAMQAMVPMEKLGSTTYFKKVRDLQTKMIKLQLEGCEYNDAQIVSAAIRHFKESPFNINQISAIHAHWIVLNRAEKVGQPDDVEEHRTETIYGRLHRENECTMGQR